MRDDFLFDGKPLSALGSTTPVDTNRKKSVMISGGRRASVQRSRISDNDKALSAKVINFVRFHPKLASNLASDITPEDMQELTRIYISRLFVHWSTDHSMLERLIVAVVKEELEEVARDSFVHLSSVKRHDDPKFLDYLVEDICGTVEVVGYFKHVCEQSISRCAKDPKLGFDVASFTDLAVQHFCDSLMESVSVGRVPGIFRSLFRGLSRSSGSRITPETVMTEQIVPKVVQVFYSWLVLPSSSMVTTWGESKVSRQLQIVDALREALNHVFASGASPDQSRSLAEVTTS